MNVKIVSTLNLLNQTTVLPTTTLFATEDGGDFMVSAYISLADDSGSGIGIDFRWNDGVRNELASDHGDALNGTARNSNAGQGGWGQTNFVIHMAPNSTVLMVGLGEPITPHYNLFVSVEEI